jgi:hypothetical protein
MADSRHSRSSSIVRDQVSYAQSNVKSGLNELKTNQGSGSIYQYGSSSNLNSSIASSQNREGGVSYNGQIGQIGSSNIYQPGSNISSSGVYQYSNIPYQNNLQGTSGIQQQSSLYQSTFNAGSGTTTGGYTYQNSQSSSNLQQGQQGGSSGSSGSNFTSGFTYKKQ